MPIPTLKYANLYYFIPLFFLFLLLFPFPEGQTTFNLDTTFDAFHLPLFFILNIILIKISSTKFSKNIHIALICSLALFFAGLLIEIIQPYFDRSFSYKDITTNFLGVLLSYLTLSKTPKKSMLIKITSIFALAFITIPIYYSYSLYNERIQSFPKLFDPASELAQIAKPTYKSTLKENQSCGLLVIPSSQNWSGVEINFGYSDWSKYSLLRIQLQNPNDSPISLALRIDDNGDNTAYESRFNETVNIAANESIKVEIPLSYIINSIKTRSFNLKSMDRALIFPLNSSNPFCLGTIDLK